MPADTRDHHDGSSTRPFTVEQKAAVTRVRKCKATDFYDILGLEEVRVTCSDGEIKKAYRKLSLLTHPDKNGYKGADEAFKMVSRAFQVLSDTDKKLRYDQTGGDPDSRFSGASASGASPFAGFASQGGPRARGPMFDGEISPEELFRQFFGGGGGGGGFGGPFGGNNGFVFNMGGGPGIRIHQFGGHQPRRRPQNPGQPQQPASPLAVLSGVLPLILLVVLPLISSLFSSSGTQYPTTRWDAIPPQTELHTSRQLNVPYYVNPIDVREYTNKKWKELDKIAEGRYINKLSGDCQWEQNTRARMFQEAQGFWSRNEQKWEAARQYPMPACRQLNSWGYQVQ